MPKIGTGEFVLATVVGLAIALTVARLIWKRWTRK